MEGNKMFLTLISVLSLVLCLACGDPPLQIEETRGFRLAQSHSRPRSSSAEDLKFRLPQSVTPEYYRLYLRPILDDDTEEIFTAPGSITMRVLCTQNTNQVSWHKHPDLNITESTVKIVDVSSNAEVKILQHSFEEENQFYNVSLDASLEANKRYEISMNFVAPIADSTAGLYRAQYEESPGVIKWMATTQFESPFARQAFPCFDEPNQKAIFEISIARTTTRYSLSNSAKRETGATDPDLPAGYVWDHYLPTVNMSTYLIAFIVSEFTCSKASDDNIFPGRPVQICGPKNLIDMGGGEFAADQSAKILKFLEDTFAYPYEMHKMDSAAIPRNYFAAGAMENYGLNTYRDNYLLFYKNESGEANRQQISSILTHELGHQWFGNLVTCKWWSNIWLNEGWATYVSFMYNQVSPEFDTQNEFLWDSVQYALTWDVGRNMPVLNSATTVEEVDSVFGTNTYDKGGSLLRMMEGFLTQETLINASVKYLNDFAYQAAEQDDLFGVVNEFAIGKIPEHLTVKEIMDTWTLKSGYPLIRVMIASKNRVYISQQECLPVTAIQVASQKDLVDNELWEVPLAIATANEPNFTDHTPDLWLAKNALIESYEHDTSSWIVVNADAMSYVRVLYDDELFTLILDQLSKPTPVISKLSRSQLIDDYFHFSKLGHASIEKALDLTKYLGTETEHVVWYATLTSLTKALTMFDSDAALRNYLRPKIDSALDILSGTSNWEDEVQLNTIGPGTRTLFIAKLLDWSCALKSDRCRKFANRIFKDWVNKPDDRTDIIPVDFQPIIYCAGVDQFTHFFLLEQYTNAETVVHKDRFLNAAGCLQDDTTLENYLTSKVLNLTGPCTENCVISEHTIRALQRTAMNTAGRPIVWRILRDEANFDPIKNSLTESAFSDVVSTLSSYFYTQGELDELTAFIESHEWENQNVLNSLQGSKRAIQVNMDWWTQYGNAMKTWFEAAIVP